MNPNILLIAVAVAGSLQWQRLWTQSLGDAAGAGANALGAVALGLFLGFRSPIRLPLAACAFLPPLGLVGTKFLLLSGVNHPVALLGGVILFSMLLAMNSPRLPGRADIWWGVMAGAGLAMSGKQLTFLQWSVLTGAVGLAFSLVSLSWKQRSSAAILFTVLAVGLFHLQKQSVRDLVAAQSTLHRWVLLENGSEDPWRSDSVLYGNGVEFFKSASEPGSHQCLSRVPLEWLNHQGLEARRVAVIGPELGMVVRDLVETPSIREVHVITPDATALKLARENGGLRTYNRDSLRSPKVKAVIEDPFEWSLRRNAGFDAILLALPRPRTWRESRYFSAEFFAQLLPKTQVLALTAGSLPEGDAVHRWAGSLRSTLAKLKLEPHLFGDLRSKHAYFIVPTVHAWNARRFFQSEQMLSTSADPQVCRHNPRWKFSPQKALTLNHLRLPRSPVRYTLSQLSLLPE